MVAESAQRGSHPPGSTRSSAQALPIVTEYEDEDPESSAPSERARRLLTSHRSYVPTSTHSAPAPLPDMDEDDHSPPPTNRKTQATRKVLRSPSVSVMSDPPDSDEGESNPPAKRPRTAVVTHPPEECAAPVCVSSAQKAAYLFGLATPTAKTPSIRQGRGGGSFH